MKIQVNEFKGIMPKLANDKLPSNMAQIAADLKTASGELTAYRASTSDVELSGCCLKVSCYLGHVTWEFNNGNF